MPPCEISSPLAGFFADCLSILPVVGLRTAFAWHFGNATIFPAVQLLFMDIRQNPLWLSLPVGRLFRTEIRVSVWFFLLALIFGMRLGWEVGIAVTGLLFVSILIHEFAHILAARKTGGSGHEILIWPLGGLAFANPAPNFFSEIWTIAAGPISNGILCLCCLPFVISSNMVMECLSPLYLPNVDLSVNLSQGLLLLMFSLNFKLLLLNLLPIYPLDGGQLAFTWAKVYWDRQTARIGSLWVGMICCILLVLGAAIVESVDLVIVGSILMMLCHYEYIASQVSRPYDDSFMGYDFSQGYTSLEGAEEREQIRGPGMLERWRRQKAEKKREKEQLLKLETERRLDELLEKIHLHGKASLTADEQRFLQRASGRYRSPGKE